MNRYNRLLNGMATVVASTKLFNEAEGDDDAHLAARNVVSDQMNDLLDVMLTEFPNIPEPGSEEWTNTQALLDDFMLGNKTFGDLTEDNLANYDDTIICILVMRSLLATHGTPVKDRKRIPNLAMFTDHYSDLVLHR